MLSLHLQEMLLQEHNHGMDREVFILDLLAGLARRNG